MRERRLQREYLVRPLRRATTSLDHAPKMSAQHDEIQHGYEGNVSGVYRVTEIIGTSNVSWEDAAKTAVETAAKSLRDLRVAEVTKLDMKIDGGKVVAYRAKVSLILQVRSLNLLSGQRRTSQGKGEEAVPARQLRLLKCRVWGPPRL